MLARAVFSTVYIARVSSFWLVFGGCCPPNCPPTCSCTLCGVRLEAPDIFPHLTNFKMERREAGAIWSPVGGCFPLPLNDKTNWLFFTRDITFGDCWPLSRPRFEFNCSCPFILPYWSKLPLEKLSKSTVVS